MERGDKTGVAHLLSRWAKRKNAWFSTGNRLCLLISKRSFSGHELSMVGQSLVVSARGYQEGY